MKIDFNKLQQLFATKVKNEEKLLLRGQDISFIIQPNYEFESYHLTVKMMVFGEEFSLGYPDKNTTEEQLINDCYSRLHDYSTDDPKYHIIGLKTREFKRRYANNIQSLREKILHKNTEMKPEDLWIDISDIEPSDEDERGFPKFEMFVSIKGEEMVTKDLLFYDYNFKLEKEIEEELSQKLNLL